jgi:hypothetical protein
LQVDAAYGHEPGEVLGEILGLEDGLRAHQLDVPSAPDIGAAPDQRRSLQLSGSA